MRALLAAGAILLSLAATRPADAVQTSKVLSETLGKSYDEIRHRRWHRVKRYKRVRSHGRRQAFKAGGCCRGQVARLPRSIKGRLAQVESKFGRVQIASICRPGATFVQGGRRHPSWHGSCRAVDFSPPPGQRKAVIAWLKKQPRIGYVLTYGWSSHIHIDNALEGRSARKRTPVPKKEWPRAVAHNKIPKIDILREAMPLTDFNRDRVPPREQPQIAEPTYARVEDDHAEVSIVDENGFLPPIRPQDRVNIFKAYEAGILRPVGNCKEFERVDQRIRRVVSDAAKHFGGVALAYSCYRDAKHNRRVGGARKSMHVQRKALDFTVRLKDGLVNKLKLAMWVRKHPLMQKVGGVGIYCGNGIHADVGGKRNWNWCGTLLADGTHARKGKRKGSRYALGGKRKKPRHG